MNRHNHLAVLSICTALITSVSWAADRMITLNFRDSPLNQVLEFYSHITGTTVTVEKASYPTITLQPGKRLSDGEAIQLIESCLASNGVKLTRSPQGATVAPDKGRMPTNGSVVRFNEQQVISPPSTPLCGAGPNTGTNQDGKTPIQFTDDELRNHFIDYRRQLREAGLPQPPLTAKEIELGIKEE